jgi:hypothetical protein
MNDQVFFIFIKICNLSFTFLLTHMFYKSSASIQSSVKVSYERLNMQLFLKENDRHTLNFYYDTSVYAINNNTLSIT